MKAWREMQQRQQEFYRGFDQESPAGSKSADGDLDAEYSQDVKDHLENGGRCEESRSTADEDDEPVSFCPTLWPEHHCLLISRSSPWHTCSGVLI